LVHSRVAALENALHYKAPVIKLPATAILNTITTLSSGGRTPGSG